MTLALQPKSIDFEAVWKGSCQETIKILFEEGSEAVSHIEAASLYK